MADGPFARLEKKDEARDDSQRDGHDDPELRSRTRMVDDLDRAVYRRDGGGLGLIGLAVLIAGAPVAWFLLHH